MALDSTLRLSVRSSGFSAAELAAATPRVGAATVHAWLAGEKLPGRDHLIARIRVLGITAGALVSELATQLNPARTRGESYLLTAYRGLTKGQQSPLIEVACNIATTHQHQRRPLPRKPDE